MERKTVIRIVIFNLILSSLIALDHLLPGKESVISELNSIYGFTAISGNSRKPKMDAKIILELSNGERYRIGKAPNKDYGKGHKIIIIKSLLSNNVNKIKILDNNWKIFNVGLFSNYLILIVLLLSILVNILNIYFKNKALDIALILSMMFTPIIFIVYNIYF